MDAKKKPDWPHCCEGGKVEYYSVTRHEFRCSKCGFKTSYSGTYEAAKRKFRERCSCAKREVTECLNTTL